MGSFAYSDHERLIKKTASKVLRRCWAAGAQSVQMDDIVSELSIAWCIANEKWDPAKQVPFVAYLMQGMYHHINRWVQEQIDQWHMAPFSLDYTVDYNPGEKDGHALHDAIADPQVIPADKAIETSNFKEFVLGKMSPRARQFVELLDNTPPELIAQLKPIRARVRFAKQRGIATFAPAEISAALIFDFMGAPRAERTKIIAELKALAKKVSHP